MPLALKTVKDKRASSKLEKDNEKCNYFIVDEVSMISCEMVYAID